MSEMESIRVPSPYVIRHEIGGICTEFDDDAFGFIGEVANWTTLLFTVYWSSFCVRDGLAARAIELLSSSRRSASSKTEESKKSLSLTGLGAGFEMGFEMGSAMGVGVVMLFGHAYGTGSAIGGR